MEFASTTDLVWVLVCTGLVLLMQVGFCCLETGLVRSKNSINVAIKNLADLCIASLIFWAAGFGLMFGASASGLVGTDLFLFEGDASQTTFFLFQLAFCGAATTIVAGAVAERMRFGGYMATAALVSGAIYPFIGHWVWNESGWLASMGFIDFAGASVVHVVGGFVALAAVLQLGAREGRFGAKGSPIQGHDIPFAMIGVMLLWVGWVGFNGGSTMGMTDDTPNIILVTMLCGASGGLTGLILTWGTARRADVLAMMNGALAGLVASTAGAHAYAPSTAILVGALGSVVFLIGDWLLNRFQIDDAIGAFPVHGCVGVFSLLAVPLFGSVDAFAGNSRIDQFWIQAAGAGAIIGYVFVVSSSLLWLLGGIRSLRIEPDAERIGLNMAEHGATTAVFELLSEMSAQAHLGDLDQDVHVDPFTDIGQIAALYNGVLARVRAERESLERSHRELVKRQVAEETAKKTLQETVGQLEEFNRLAVGRELHMIDLKREVNELAVLLKRTPPYDLTFEEEHNRQQQKARAS